MRKPELGQISTKEISNAAMKVAMGGVFSLAAGLASQVLTAYLFGAGADMDAYFTSMTIPLYLQIVILGGLPFVVIPAFVREECAGNSDDAWSITGTMALSTGLFLLVISIIGSIVSPWIISICAPGFNPSKAELAARMLSIMVFTVPFSGIGSFTSGVENARGRYFWPAAATAIGSLGNVIVLVILTPLVGSSALAYGNLTSAILAALVTIIPTFQHGWKRLLPIRDPRILELFRLIAPFIIFGLVTHSRVIFERFFASTLPDGQLSYMGYANKLSNIFVVLLAGSIASAYFPAMARAYSENGTKGLNEQTEAGLKITLALAFPVIILISVFAIPIIQLFFERGAFLADTTYRVSILVPIFMVNEVLFRMITNIIGRAFFVLKDTVSTNLITSLTIVIYLISAYFLTKQFQYWGLALAQPIQVFFSIVLMGIWMARKIPSFQFVSVFISSIKYLAASVVAGCVAWVSLRFTSNIIPLFQLAIGGCISGLTYMILLYFLETPTLMTILEMTGIPRIMPRIRNRLQAINSATHL